VTTYSGSYTSGSDTFTLLGYKTNAYGKSFGFTASDGTIRWTNAAGTAAQQYTQINNYTGLSGNDFFKYVEGLSFIEDPETGIGKFLPKSNPTGASAVPDYSNVDNSHLMSDSSSSSSGGGSGGTAGGGGGGGAGGAGGTSSLSEMIQSALDQIANYNSSTAPKQNALNRSSVIMSQDVSQNLGASLDQSKANVQSATNALNSQFQALGTGQSPTDVYNQMNTLTGNKRKKIGTQETKAASAGASQALLSKPTLLGL
jgi:hypothetical protein